MRVHLKTLGCRLNEAELASWRQDFAARGHRITDSVDDADLLVVNTCAVTAEAARKSRQLIRKAQRHNPQAKLVISGCYASLEADSVNRESGVDLVVSNQEKNRLVEIATRELLLPTMPATAQDDPGLHLLQSGRQRAFIKVQDGCRYRCTYCIVTLARGEEQSRLPGDIIDEINRLHASGIQEVVLTGVHLGGYGSDTGSNLKSLMETVLRETDVPRIRIGSLEPWDLPDDFWSIFSSPRMMPHLHLPIQSGSDSVLRRMARRCKTAEFGALIKSGRAHVDKLNITTDIIVGFPGETDREFEDTMEFTDKMGFGHIHIFTFSPRAGTKAATLPAQIPADIKRRRSNSLHQLAQAGQQRNLAAAVGSTQPVLVEHRDASNPNRWSGYTPNYLRVNIDSEHNLENLLVKVELTGVSDSNDQLVGRISG